MVSALELLKMLPISLAHLVQSISSEASSICSHCAKCLNQHFKVGALNIILRTSLTETSREERSCRCKKITEFEKVVHCDETSLIRFRIILQSKHD